MKSIFDEVAVIKIQKHYKISEVAELLGVCNKTVRRWIAEGKLKAHRIGRTIRIPKTELVSIIESNND